LNELVQNQEQTYHKIKRQASTSHDKLRIKNYTRKFTRNRTKYTNQERNWHILFPSVLNMWKYH